MGHGAAEAGGYGITRVKNKKGLITELWVKLLCSICYTEMNNDKNDKSNTHMEIDGKPLQLHEKETSIIFSSPEK